MSHESQSFSSSTASGHSPTRRQIRVTLLGLACLAFGLLIWSRLLLVTNYPKTAIAEPPTQVPSLGATAAVPAAADPATAD